MPKMQSQPNPTLVESPSLRNNLASEDGERGETIVVAVDRVDDGGGRGNIIVVVAERVDDGEAHIVVGGQLVSLEGDVPTSARSTGVHTPASLSTVIAGELMTDTTPFQQPAAATLVGVADVQAIGDLPSSSPQPQ